jgi:hypothetical protein
MNFAGNRNRQWWIPSLIILVAILALGLLLPGLINPSQVPSDGSILEATLTPANTDRSTPQSTLPVSLAVSPSPARTLQGTPVQTAASTSNCTYTMYYWINQPEAWMIENVVIGTLSYTRGEAILILQTESDDAKTLLLQQFFTALLNSLRADASVVAPTLSNASDWLDEHTLGVEVTETDRQAALSMTQTLLEYNNGLIGPGRCADEPTTPTPLPSATLTPTLTPTPTRAITSRPTLRPTATQEKDKDKPTDEPQPTDKPTSEPTKEPTKPPPKPTSTSKPRATPTSAPTDEPPTPIPPPPVPNVLSFHGSFSFT